MTDLDLIRSELDLATLDPRKAQSLALELHQLRALKRVVIQRGRRIDAIVFEAARSQPVPVDLDPPAEKGSSRDLVQLARTQVADTPGPTVRFRDRDGAPIAGSVGIEFKEI